MKSFFYKILKSEFLTFNEVLRLKVVIVNAFSILMIFISIPVSTFNNFETTWDLIIPIGITALLAFSFIFVALNFNRFAMHLSIWTVGLITLYYTLGSQTFFSYMLFFMTLTIIIFYQDILTYLLYGVIVTGAGVYYVYEYGNTLMGVNSTSVGLSSITYQVILVSFYIVFFIQFLVSDNIYEKLNNEWVRMNKVLDRYQGATHSHLVELVENIGKDPVYKNTNFQKAVSELSCFINEFFEENGNDIAEVVEFYFFIHDQEISEVVKDQRLPVITRKYANDLSKYLLNAHSELVSMLFDFSTLFSDNEDYDNIRYEYNIEKLFSNRIDRLLVLAVLYKFLKTEITQKDKWGQVKRKLTHEEITELFVSKEFREFISFEQVNFYLDNQELFEKHL